MAGLQTETELNRIMIISRHALDCKTCNMTLAAVTWETCSLRKWLNNDFLNAAFSMDEQKMIRTVTVSADNNPIYSVNPGNDTADKTFLLSIQEANKYFSSDKERKCSPTEYAIAHGAYTSSSDSTGGKATCWWWLRSPGYDALSAGNVFYDGAVLDYGRGVDYDFSLLDLLCGSNSIQIASNAPEAQ